MTTDRTIPASELVAALSRVLDEVERGATYVVTRHGKRVATLMPASGQPSEMLAEERAAYRATPGPPEGALAQLMSAPALRRVLAIFLTDPTLQIHQREIARRAAAPLRSVQLALRRLVGLGLLGERRDGNRMYYHAIRSDRFDEVRQLFAREFGIAEVIARHLRDLEQPVEWAFIFGSAASGTDTVGSDIDLVVVTEATLSELATPMADAQRELGREIDVINYRPEEFRRRRAQGNHFVRSVLAQPRFDIIGGEDDA